MLCSPLPLHSSSPSHPLPPEVVGTLKPSITYPHFPLLTHPLAPPLPPHPLPPQRWWGLYNLVYNMLCSPSLLLTLSPLAPTEVMGTLKPSITHPCYPLLPLASLSPEVVGTLKPNITPLLPSLPLSPCHLFCRHTAKVGKGAKGVKGSKGVILNFRVPTTSVGARGDQRVARVCYTKF